MVLPGGKVLVLAALRAAVVVQVQVLEGESLIMEET